METEAQRGLREFAPCHKTLKWTSQDSTPSLFDFKASAFSIVYCRLSGHIFFLSLTHFATVCMYLRHIKDQINNKKNYHLLTTHSMLGFPGGSAGKESTYNARDLASIPGLGRSPGEGKGYLLQYSGFENSMGSRWCGQLPHPLVCTCFNVYWVLTMCFKITLKKSTKPPNLFSDKAPLTLKKQSLDLSGK